MVASIRKAVSDDAKSVASVLNSVILEGRYTAFTKPFTEDEERSFIEGLSARSALFVAEVDGKIVGIQVIADNTRALRFYGNLGFEKIGVAKKHVKFEDRFCDVFFLEKFLTDDP